MAGIHGVAAVLPLADGAPTRRRLTEKTKVQEALGKASGAHIHTRRPRMDRHDSQDAPHVHESHDIPSCAPSPHTPPARHARGGHPSWKKLDARTQRRDSRSAAQAPRQGPDGAAPSPPPSVLTDQRFRPGPMQSTADSSLDLPTLTRGRRGVRRPLAGVEAPARLRQVFSQRDVWYSIVCRRVAVMCGPSCAWCGSRVPLQFWARASLCH